MPDEHAQAEPVKPLDVAQQPQRLQRVLAEADAGIEHDAREIEPCALPFADALLEPSLDGGRRILIRRQHARLVGGHAEVVHRDEVGAARRGELDHRPVSSVRSRR